MALAIAWVAPNRPGRFGLAVFGLTTCSSFPWPGVDLQVRPDGTSRRVEKTHELSADDIAWLVESDPETLILSEGWRGAVRVPEELRHQQGLDVHVLRTPDALRLFNQLRTAGTRVAIHVHSTC
jgi:hypothetical protein